jgi:hypothetical protein
MLPGVCRYVGGRFSEQLSKEVIIVDIPDHVDPHLKPSTAEKSYTFYPPVFLCSLIFGAHLWPTSTGASHYKNQRLRRRDFLPNAATIGAGIVGAPTVAATNRNETIIANGKHTIKSHTVNREY